MQIKGFLETSFVDWTGKICSVVFAPGCNFRCPFCHNHELVLQPHRFETVPEEYVLDRLSTFRGWIDGVCITGGEPTLQPDLKDFIRRLKKTGFEVKLDSNGTRPEVLTELAEEGLLDYVAMDVKGPLNHIDYSRASGVPIRTGRRFKKYIAPQTRPRRIRVSDHRGSGASRRAGNIGHGRASGGVLSVEAARLQPDERSR